MGVLIIIIQFVASCLAVGAALFIAGEVAGEQPRAAHAGRDSALKGTAAAALAVAGVFGALSSVPF